MFQPSKYKQKLPILSFKPFLDFIKTLGSIYDCELPLFVGLAHQGKDFVFRFIIEYNRLMDFGP